MVSVHTDGSLDVNERMIEPNLRFPLVDALRRMNSRQRKDQLHIAFHTLMIDFVLLLLWNFSTSNR